MSDSPEREQAEARLRESAKEARSRFVPGTPEKYPLAAVSVRITDLEDILAAVSRLEAERDDARINAIQQAHDASAAMCVAEAGRRVVEWRDELGLVFALRGGRMDALIEELRAALTTATAKRSLQDPEVVPAVPEVLPEETP